MSRAHYGFPRWMYLLAALGLLVVLGPLVGLLTAIPWHEAGALVTAPVALSALKLSVGTAAVATVFCVLLGIPLALLTSRRLRVMTADGRPGPGAPLALVVYAPLVLSPVVSGLALMFFWGRHGVLGRWLNDLGLSVGFTSVAVVLVQVFVALPFFVATASTALHAVPAAHEDIAATEGATRWEIVRKVLIPQALPGLVTAVLLSFARALGEYGATITFAGNIAGVTRTIPLNIEIALNSNDISAALGGCIMLLALYLMVVAVMVLVRFLRGARKVGYAISS